MFKRAEEYVREYKRRERETIRLSREARKHSNYYVPPQPKLAFVIRIRGINQVAPKVKKVRIKGFLLNQGSGALSSQDITMAQIEDAIN